MKFDGKDYHEYVHARLNESLADKLEEPVSMDETKEIGKEIIEEIAKERLTKGFKELWMNTTLLSQIIQ